MQVENTVAASAEELVAWEKYKAEAQIKSIPIPYIFTTGGVNVVGVFNLEDPVENSSTVWISYRSNHRSIPSR
jgi:hypothetical protein